MDSIILANNGNLREKKVSIGLHRRNSSSHDISVASSAHSSAHSSPSIGLTIVSLESFIRPKKQHSKRWVLVLFVLIGIGLNMPYAALNGAIAYFSEIFGPAYYLNFLAAFNIPAIPLLTIQLLYDEAIDTRFGSRITFTIRLLSTFVLMTLALLAVPFGTHSFVYVMILISIIGIANGIAFGSIFQLGAIFSAKGTACIFAGLGLGNLLSTITILCMHFNDRSPTPVAHKFFMIQGALTVVGVIAIVIVMLNKHMKEVLLQKDKASRESEFTAPLLNSEINNTDKSYRQLPKPKKKTDWRTNMMVLGKTWKSQVSMFLTYFVGVTISSFVAYLPDGGLMHRGTFLLVALYVNIYGDFLGKNLTFFKVAIKSDTALLALALCRTCYLIYFFAYLTVPNFPRDDVIVLGTLCVVAIFGGYLTNMMFTIAPMTAPPEYTQQVASMVTLVLHLAVYSSIGVSYLLTKYLHFVKFAKN